MTEYPISSYAVYLISGTHSTCIQLYEHEHCRGAVRFFPDDANLEDAQLDSEGKIILNMRINRLHSILQVIRNEKPLFIFYESPEKAGIRTGRKTIGDDHMWIT